MKRNRKKSRQGSKKKLSKMSPNRAQAKNINQTQTGHPRKTPQQRSNDQNKEKGKREAQEGSHNNRPNAQALHNSTQCPKKRPWPSQNWNKPKATTEALFNR